MLFQTRFCITQPEVRVDLDIRKPSLYRVIFRYVNPNPSPVPAEVLIRPESSSEVQQTSFVFPPARRPEHLTVSGSGVVSTFVLDPGRWTVALKTSDSVLVVCRCLSCYSKTRSLM